MAPSDRMARMPSKAPGVIIALALALAVSACGTSSGPAAAPFSARPHATPTFVYPGDPQCAITYRDDGDGTMSWTATVTVAGELITHAADIEGNIYRHVVQVSPGPNRFMAPVPLSQVDDMGGNLDGAGASYGCSVAPQLSSGPPGRGSGSNTPGMPATFRVAPLTGTRHDDLRESPESRTTRRARFRL